VFLTFINSLIFGLWKQDQLDNIRFNIQNPIEALILILLDCPAYAEQRIKHSISQEGILWLKQTINNACGLYAILHCVCNTLGTKEIGRTFCFTLRGISY
jgi:ubiquitin carboxyl-terminal hydrolase L3